MKKRDFITFLSAACAGVAIAQDAYPSKPIRLIVPYPPGGGNDSLGRIVAAKLGESLGRNIVVENRSGAGTTIGTDAAAKSAPDGYTLLLSSIVTQALAPHLYNKLTYNAIRDFVPLALIGVAPTVLIASPSVKAKSLREVIAAAKAAPGRLTYASGGNGTSPHIAAEVFKLQTKTDLLHIPFKGGGPSLIALMGGEVDLMLDTAASALPHVRSGKVQGLAISTSKRHPDFPNMPTFAESGMPGFDFNSWYSVHAPAGTPPRVVNRLRYSLAAVLAAPETEALIRGLGTDPKKMTADELAIFQQAEFEKYGRIIKQANIKLD